MPSSVIRSYRYDPHAETLDVTFVSGRCYRYVGVPAQIAHAFEQAESKGRFFNVHVRDVFAFEEPGRRRVGPG